MPKTSETPTGENVLDLPQFAPPEEKQQDNTDLSSKFENLQKMFEDYKKQNEITPATIPQSVINTSDEPLEKPKRILYTFNAIEDEDAKYEDGWIPGKALVSVFKFVDHLKCDLFGNKYSTGFEVDELEFTSGLTGEALAKYQEEVRKARRWIERVEGINLDSKNKQFWSTKSLKLEALGFIYDTDANVDNLITYYNILGGGYPTIGRSYEDAKANGLRLYISIQEVEAERSFDKKRTFIKANAQLDYILDNWKTEDALYLMYYLPIKKQLGYTKNTPKTQIVNQLGDFIDGVDTKTEKTKRPKQFLEALKMFDNPTEKDILRTTALFKAAEYYGYVQFYSKERLYKNRQTGFDFGNSAKTAVDALLNPKNMEELSWLKSKVNEKWSN